MSPLISDARQIYNHFKLLPGSQYIATQHAIDGLRKWLMRREPKTILEVGSGIGTLTFTTLAILSSICGGKDSAAYKFTSIENNDFCLTELRKNLGDYWTQFELLRELPEPPAKVGPFDFVIIDGGNQNPNFISNLSQRATVFIEGFMDKKHTLVANSHKQRAWIRTNFRSRDRMKGYWIFQFEPSATEIVWFRTNDLYNRLHSGIRKRLPSTQSTLSSG